MPFVDVCTLIYVWGNHSVKFPSCEMPAGTRGMCVVVVDGEG
jgi:hypothetical protein